MPRFASSGASLYKRLLSNCLSNILADIYLRQLDQFMFHEAGQVLYIRYVDDILIMGSRVHLSNIVSRFRDKIEKPEKLSLKLNEDKTFSNCPEIEDVQQSESFEYLGYFFSSTKISPKKGSEEKFLRAVMSLFSEFRHAIKTGRKRRKRINLDLLKKTFLFRLNEKLTGAISEKRKYGWIFYFIEMNDLSSLYRIDKIVAREFEKLEAFDRTAPQELKKIVRAYYAALYSPTDGYIHNYNRYKTDDEKESFLVENGYIPPNKQFNNMKIRRIYAKIRNENLAYLVQDETFIY